MRLEVLQAVAICCSGNEYLASGDEVLLIEAQLRSCFKGIDSLEFRKAPTHHFAGPGAGIIEGTKTWYRRLKSDGVDEIRPFLPLSLASPNPAIWGLVTDSESSSDIWVPTYSKSAGSQRSLLEFSAQRFTPWNMRQRLSADSALDGLVASWEALAQTLGEFDAVAKLTTGELLNLQNRTTEAAGFEDTFPITFKSTSAAVCAGAIRAVIALSSLAPGVQSNPLYATLFEAIWQSAMRCFEATGPVDIAKAA